ncbi:AraC-like DNA-binding protein [Flavobacterium arsenatis]|uniref:AraC-like DNA-binding protein n=1 Tax=Flavobacterium arsenatis TaxID=1484332 RepID=A0ABU1TQ73_9FLAO|nr:helix-turn-helix domain-containing protein [Flavobacterium arsenatis]MDR6968120.1 AraC-like DNA-binding protein [Flavobacterium arsenatis]
MHTKIKVCNLAQFDTDFQHLLICDLEDFQATFQELQMPHKNDFYTILFVDDAIGVVQIDNAIVYLEQAKIIVIEPGCVNTINFRGKARGKVICFSETFFSLRYNNNILNHFGFLETENRVISELSESQSEKFESLLKLIHQEYLLHSEEGINILRSYINIILFELERLLSPENVVRKTDVKLDKINQFKKLIEKHYSKHKLPSYYADKLNITTNHLNKLCKEETGRTAGDLIRKHIRIESQRQLRFTTLSINEIADELGFESPSYFITFFKKQVGITPEQFRKEQ